MIKYFVKHKKDNLEFFEGDMEFNDTDEVINNFLYFQLNDFEKLL